MRRLRIGVLGLVIAAAAAAGAAHPLAGDGSAKLLSIGMDAGAVVIEASEPVAYAVTRPDPFTVLVDLRDVRADNAKNRFRPSPQAAVSAVVIDEMSAPDGSPLTRVMMQLSKPLQHTATHIKGKIRIEFTGSLGSTGSTGSTGSMGSVPVAGSTGSSVPAATVLTAVAAEGAGPITRVTLRGNGWVAPSGLDELKDGSIVVDLPGVAPGELAAVQPLGIVSSVRAERLSDTPLVTRVVIAPKKRAAYRAERAGEKGVDYVVVFDESANPAAAAVDPAFGPDTVPDPNAAPPASDFAAAAPAGAIDPMSALKTQQAPAPPARQTQAPAPPTATQAPGSGQRQYQGHNISLDLQGSPLRDVLRLFANISGLNMVIDAAIEGTVDIILTEVPWDQALEIVLRAHNLGYTIDGTVVRIAKLDTLRQEENQRAQLEKARLESGELLTRTYNLSYAQAQQISEMLTRGRIISERGQTVVDERTNTLIITDLAARQQAVSQLIGGLDRPEPQVEIEARIVQTSRDFARSIGIQWGLNGRVSPEIGNTTGLAFPNNGSLGGRTGVNGNLGNDLRANPLDAAGTVVNMPVQGATTGIGLALGAINGSFNLDVALSALERSGKGRVLSTPRVTTQNNNPAEMYQGIQIPIQTVANNTVTVTFKDAALLLRVTPQVTAAGTVIMQIQLENATADFSRQVNGIPPIDTQRAITRVQIDDGATTVIGGIFVSREQAIESRTPVLHRIPLLGWLFKRNENQDESRELMIFITPRVLRS